MSIKKTNMSLIEELKNRGLFYQCTDEEMLNEIFNKYKIKFYVGFDCTATSLHVGNLTQLMLVRTLQKHGHEPIILLGNATTEVGDPTGKDEMRKMLTPREIEDNIEGILHSISKIVDLTDVKIVRNKSWLDDISYLKFLTTWGKKISVNKMFSMDIVKNRLDNNLPLSFLEFNYMILQGYDFCYLNQKYECILQTGGKDQWGNITFGVEMSRKFLQTNTFGLTTPLIVNSDGRKMGKTEKGAIWLNEDMLSAYDYFQYWRNMTDADVVRFGKLFGELNEEEIVSISNINKQKEFVAHKITAICHGVEAADNALYNAQKVFSGDINAYPVHYVAREFLELELIDLVAHFVSARSEARRYINDGVVFVNGEKNLNLHAKVQDLIKQESLNISIGKKRHYSVVFE